VTDSKFLLAVLSDGNPHSQADLLRRSFEERGFGCTVHSRIADLRERGYIITCERVPGKTRGEAWRYQLLASPLPEPTLPTRGDAEVQLGLDGLHRREHEAA
jgi:hypothetical protein